MIVTKFERLTLAAIVLVWGVIWVFAAIYPGRLGGWERHLGMVVTLLAIGQFLLIRTLTDD